MNSKNLWMWIVAAAVIIGLAWLFLDRRYTQVLPADMASSTVAADSAAPAVPAAATPAATPAPTPSPVTNSPAKNFMHTITIKTSKGTIVFETYDADAPNTVNNFIT